MLSPQKKLINEARQKLDIKSLFPRSKIDFRRNTTPYQVKKIKKALRELENVPIPKTRIPAINLDHYRKAGFDIYKKSPVIDNDKFKLRQFYGSEGESSFYSASFFGGVVNAQLIPTVNLPEYIDKLITAEMLNGKFYDRITFREGDRNLHGMELPEEIPEKYRKGKKYWAHDRRTRGFTKMFDDAEEVFLYLTQYKRHGGLLIGENTTLEYIQVCFINFGG